MRKCKVNEGKQLELMNVKEATLENLPAKRVEIVSLRLMMKIGPVFETFYRILIKVYNSI